MTPTHGGRLRCRRRYTSRGAGAHDGHQRFAQGRGNDDRQLVDRQSKVRLDGFDPGFGEAAVTALENALTDYLTRTRQGVFAEAVAQALKVPDDNAAKAEPAKAEKFPDDGNGKSIAETQAASKKADARAKKSNRPRKAKTVKVRRVGRMARCSLGRRGFSLR